MLVYTIIVTFNGIKWVDKCFDSLLNSSVTTKVIVIDNLSTDGTPEQIRAMYPSVEVIEPGENLGFGRANNIGLARAVKEGADYVFLLNQDAWVEPDTIEKLVAAHTKDFGILSPMHLNGEGNALDVNFANCLLGSSNPGLVSALFLGELDAIYEVKRANAAAWLLDVKTVQLIGGFDPDFFMYGEDDNYMHRVKYHGLKIGVHPAARIYHDRHYRSDNNKWNDLYKEKTAFMVFFKDLNSPMAQQTIRFVLSQCKSILRNLNSMRLRSLIENFLLANFIFCRLLRLATSRQIAREKSPFLNK